MYSAEIDCKHLVDLSKCDKASGIEEKRLIAHQSCILVVDDNDSVRDILTLLLEGRGHRVVLAKHGQEALAVMQREPIDLILLDIMMPVMDGYDVLRWMRADPELSSKPVVVLTAINDTESIINCIEMGADDYLFKPINRAVLMARVDASVEKKRLRDVEHQHIMELAILQQIDRELNASLDLNEVARITLGWAMRQTNSQGGMIGLVEDGKMHVLQKEHLPFEEDAVVLLKGLAGAHGEDSRLHSVLLTAEDRFAPKLAHRIIVPIQRAGIVDCLLILEKETAPRRQNLDFLSRLRDHAAIAIVNAQLYAAVQEANRAKSDFISLVSHELKTPIAVIRNYSELLVSGRGGEISSKQHRFVETIRTNVLRMKALVTDLDDISRIETGRLRLDFAKVELQNVLDEVVKSVEQQANQKQQQIFIQLQPELPALWADRFRLSQILTNLLSNASKYSPEQRDIFVRATLVTKQEDSFVQIEVEDNGIGIHDADKLHIFKQFFRSADKEVRAALGTGLGLNIARRLVMLHDGDIWFESDYRQGTTFYFTIPIAQTTVSLPQTS